MRIVIIFLLSLVSFVGLAQDTSYSGSTLRNTVAIRNQLVVNRFFRLPKDTITSAVNGSMAYLPGGIYYKDTTWKRIAGVTGGGGGGSNQTLQQVLTTGSTLTGNNVITVGTSSNTLRFQTGLTLFDKIVVGNDHNGAVADNEFYGTNYMANLLIGPANTGNIVGGAFVLNSPATSYGILKWTQGGATRANQVNLMFNGDGTDGPKYGQLDMNSSLTSSYNGWTLNFDMRGGVHPFRYFGRKYGSATARTAMDWGISEDGNTIMGSNTDGADGRLQVTGGIRTDNLKITSGTPASGKVWTATDALGNGSWQAATGGGGSQTFQQVLTTGSTLTQSNTVTQSAGQTFRIAGGTFVVDSFATGLDHHNRLYRNEFTGNSFFANLQTDPANTGNIFAQSFTLNSPSTNFGLIRWSQGGAFRANTVQLGFNGDATDGPKYGDLTLNSTLTNSYNGMNLNFDMRGGVHPIRYFGRKYGSASFRSAADWNISEDGNTILGSNTDVTGKRFQVTGNTLLTGGLKISNGNMGVGKVWTDTSGTGDGAWQTVSGGGLSGGTADYLARWTGASALSIGATRDDGTNVGIGVAPGTYKLNVNGSLAAQGAIHSIGAASAFQVYRRDNSALAFSILSSSGNLDLYDIAGSATRVFMTPAGLWKYAADMSGSYDDRTMVDKGFSKNASNLATGTVPTARLGSGTANSTSVLTGNQVWTQMSSLTNSPYHGKQEDDVITLSTLLTTLQTISVPDNTSGIITCWIQGMRQSSLDTYTRQIIFRVKKVSGTLTVGTPSETLPVQSETGTAGSTVTVANSSGSVVVQVTAGTASAIEWKVTTGWVYKGSSL